MFGIEHNLILAGKITGSAIAGLILVSTAIATVRAILDRNTPLLPWIVTDVAAAELRASKESWLHRSLAAFDIAFNVIVLRGQQDETISTHSWRAAQEGKLWGKAMTLWLDGFQPNHGPRAASGDLERATVRVAVLKKALGLQ